MVRAVSDHYGEPIDFLTNPSAAGMLRGHPCLREILVFDKRGKHKGPLGLMAMARELRKRNYVRAFSPHRSWRTAMLLKSAKIRRRVGFDNASGVWMYNDVIPYQKKLHEIERNLCLLGSGVDKAWQRPRMYPRDEEWVRASELAPSGPYVAIAPGSVWATKRWPQENYAELVRRLRHAEFDVVLLGGKEDVDLHRKLIQPGVLDLAGRTNLRESYALLERASCLVCNDSAPMHMGVAAGIPVVAIYCSTSPSFGFAPKGERDVVLEVDGLSCRPCGIHGHPECPERHFACGTRIDVDQVFQAVLERLPERRKQPR